MATSPAERRDVVRDAVALIVASFDEPDLATTLVVGLVDPRPDDDLSSYAARLGSTLATTASAAASFIRQWAIAAGHDERALLARYAEQVSADLNARDLADGTQPEGNPQ